jgi:hypothetical protein
MIYGTTRGTGTGTGTYPTKYFFQWPQKCKHRIRSQPVPQLGMPDLDPLFRFTDPWVR